MRLDVFVALSQTPRPTGLPPHDELLREFLNQAVLADELGFTCLWVAESHYSIEAQKLHRRPAAPQWEGEIGLNTDICQLAAHVFARTGRIEIGSAIMNIVANGGPLPAAERVATALAWHGLAVEEHRRLHIGFASGRFDFMAEATGVAPRTDWEQLAWPQVKRLILDEAGEIFIRLLNGETIASSDVTPHYLRPDMFSDAAAFDAVRRAAGTAGDEVPLPPRWSFEPMRVVPDFRRELLRLLVGSQDPAVQVHLNQFAPVDVFNLSITAPAVIDATHRRMSECCHPVGGPWRRDRMPRTTFVFVEGGSGMSQQAQRLAAQERARRALAGYWRAIAQTLSEEKIRQAVDNALVGSPSDVARQIVERFDPEDRLMLWFDFFADSEASVLTAMETFACQVVPLLGELGVPVHDTISASRRLTDDRA